MRALVLTLVLVALSSARADEPSKRSVVRSMAAADDASLRVVGLNIAGLRPKKTHTADSTTPTQYAINQEYASFLLAQDKLSASVGARTAFALQEVAMHCVYFSNGDQFHGALDALGPRYTGDRSLDACGPNKSEPQGYMAKAVLTDGTVLRSASVDMGHPLDCHRSSAHAMKIRVSGELTVWVASVHFSQIPWVSIAQLRAFMTWLRLVTSEDWNRHPILIVGDFNIVALGIDRSLDPGWSQTVCDGVARKTVTVTSANHAQAFSEMKAEAAARGFEQVLGLNVGKTRWPGATWRAWDNLRKVDYALIRNPPCDNCVAGHPTPPMGDSAFYFADHMGYVVTILTPKQAARRKAQQHFLAQ